MKTTLFATLLVISTLTFASNDDLIQLRDGHVSRCASRIDVARHDLSGAYRPVSLEKRDGEAEVKIEFLRCVEKNGKFGFEREFNLEDKTINPVLNPEREIQIERSKISLIVVDAGGKIIDRQALKKEADGLYTALVKTETENYDDSPAGRKSVIINVQSFFKMTDVNTGVEIDRGMDTYGAYRLVVK